MADEIIVESPSTVQVIETAAPNPVTISNVAGAATVVETADTATEVSTIVITGQTLEVVSPVSIEVVTTNGNSFLIETSTGPTGYTPKVYSGAAPPSEAAGTVGDLYLVNTGGTLGDLYQKGQGGWGSPLANLKGGIATVNGKSGTNIVIGADDITTGVLPIGQVPTGTTGSTVALGNHNHTGVYEPVIASGTTSQFWRGDKSWQIIDKNTVGLANVNNTSDANKPVSTAQQSALDLKANIASPTFTGTVSGITAAMVGLGAVANLVQVDLVNNQTVGGVKTFSNAPIVPSASFGIIAINGLQAALDLKSPLANPTFTGTVSGVTKAMVGLGNVANVDTTVASNITTGTLALAIIPTGTTGSTVALGNHNHDTVYVALTGTQTIAGVKTFSSNIIFDSGPGAAKLYPAAADHTYMEFHARTATPSTRSGYIGYGAGGVTTLGIVNEITNGAVAINANGTGNVVLTGTLVQAAGNFATTGGLRVGISATAGYVLTADASGNATWQATANIIVPGTTAQYYRGDLTWQTLNAAAVGLGNVANVVQVDLTSGQTITGAKVMNSASNVFTGNGAALTALNASNLATGTVPQARTSPNLQRFVFTTGSESRPTGTTYVEWIGPVTPTNATNDDVWVDTSVGLVEDPVISMPIGTIQMFASSAAPTNWLTCNGQAVSRTTYSALWTLIGTTYGAGDGTTTFNLPNVQGRFPAGYMPSNTKFDAMGETGGAETVTLGITEMPAHTHLTGVVNATAFGTAGAGGYSLPTGAAQTGLATASTGGGAAHENLPPYITLHFIIKVL